MGANSSWGETDSYIYPCKHTAEYCSTTRNQDMHMYATECIEQMKLVLLGPQLRFEGLLIK